MTITNEVPSTMPNDTFGAGTIIKIGEFFARKHPDTWKWELVGDCEAYTWEELLKEFFPTDEDRNGLTIIELVLAPEVRQIRGELAEAKRQHASDIAHIEETLNQEANDRDWCDEYDTILERLNSNLNIEIKPRKRTFTVDVTIVHTVEVVASDSEAARQDAAYELTLDGDYEIQDISVR